MENENENENEREPEGETEPETDGAVEPEATAEAFDFAARFDAIDAALAGLQRAISAVVSGTPNAEPDHTDDSVNIDGIAEQPDTFDFNFD